MNAIIQSAKKHFKDQKTKEIKVPEWSDSEGKPLVIYADTMTVKDRNWTVERSGGANVSTLVYTIIRMAKSKDGNRLFTIEDKRALMTQVDSAIVIRIANKITAGADVESIKKK